MSSRETIEEYQLRLRSMSNRSLIAESGAAILGAAVMAGFRCNDGYDDDKAYACYSEAVRRGNPDLYQRGFNDAVSSQGHQGMRSPTPTPIEVGEPT